MSAKAPDKTTRPRVTARISDELRTRLDGILAHVPRAIAPNENALLAIALEEKCAALEKRFNGGKPFKAPKVAS